MQTTTIKIKKTHVFAAIFMVILAITIFMLINAYNEYKKSLPAPITDVENIELIQLEPKKEDAATAIISTNKGDFQIVLYTEETPNAAEIFMSNANSGQYNGLNISLFEEGSVLTVDSPELSQAYTSEFHNNLWPFKGAIAMTESGDLVMINTVEFSQEDRQFLEQEQTLAEVCRAFLDYGGVPNYSRKYAVFAQITDGIDVLEALADSSSDETIIINSVTVNSAETK